ncbi:hypothetical protein QOT17_022189 [Balamuthia mandrillaris]
MDILTQALPNINKMFDFTVCCLQQDGASAHTLKANLSPIENLWAIISDKVQAKNLKTFKELQEAMDAAGDEISLAQIKRLISSIPSHPQSFYLRLRNFYLTCTTIFWTPFISLFHNTYPYLSLLSAYTPQATDEPVRKVIKRIDMLNVPQVPQNTKTLALKSKINNIKLDNSQLLASLCMLNNFIKDLLSKTVPLLN